MRSLALVFACLVGCVRSAAVVCDDGRICPTDNVCDEVNQVCVYPDQLTSCLGIADGTACDINQVPGGICRGEICIAARCGDGLVVGTETCDGASDIPDVGTCVDFAYDYGSLSCSAQCTEGLGSCGRLGWQFRSLNGAGGVGGIWEDGDDLYVTTQMGILRRHAGVWQPTELAQTWWRGVWAGGGHAFAAGNNGQVAHFDGTAWTTMPVSAQVLAGIWGRSPTEVYAVGGRSGAGEAWRFDGTAWSAMQLPAGTPHLESVWGDETSAFAVGNDGTILQLENKWVEMASGTSFRLTSVWGSGPNDVFVTGTPTAAEPVGTLAIILHFDGAEWQPLKVPAGTLDLRSLSGRSAKEIYAVGSREGSNILFWDGQVWAPMVSEVDGAALRLNAVHAGASMVYAASRPDLFLEYLGAGWVESLADFGAVRGIWGSSASYMIAVGDGLAFREYRGAWGFVPYPPCWGLTNFVFDVWGSASDDVWIVGPYGKMIHKQSDTLSCVDLPSGKWIADIWGSSANNVFAVGADGTGAAPNLAHYDGVAWADWSDRIQPFVTTLSGVWGASASDVYAVGDKKILHYDGATWTDTGVASEVALTAIWGSSASDIFVVGDSGTILHFDGAAWSEMVVPFGNTTPTDGRWSEIHGTGPTDVYVVGTRTLLHYDGATWSPIARTLASSADAVFAAPGVVVLGGDGGIDPRLIGTRSP